MPRLRNRSLASRDWGWEHKAQLRCGWDFFGTGWGDPVRDHLPQGADWPAADVLEEMREAWADCGDDVMREHTRREHRGKPWGWWVFVQGVDPLESLSLCGLVEQEALTRLGISDSVL